MENEKPSESEMERLTRMRRAFENVMTALSPISTEEQARVLRAVIILLDIDPEHPHA